MGQMENVFVCVCTPLIFHCYQMHRIGTVDRSGEHRKSILSVGGILYDM